MHVYDEENTNVIAGTGMIQRVRKKGWAARLTIQKRKRAAAATAREDINTRRRMSQLSSKDAIIHFFLASWADNQSRPSYKPSPDVAQVA